MTRTGPLTTFPATKSAHRGCSTNRSGSRPTLHSPPMNPKEASAAEKDPNAWREGPNINLQMDVLGPNSPPMNTDCHRSIPRFRFLSVCIGAPSVASTSNVQRKICVHLRESAAPLRCRFENGKFIKPHRGYDDYSLCIAHRCNGQRTTDKGQLTWPPPIFCPAARPSCSTGR